MFSPHLGLTHHSFPSGILMAGFGVGELRFNSTWYDHFICHQSYTTFKFFIYVIGSLSVVFQLATSYSVYHNLLHQEYPFYSVQLYQKTTTSILSEILVNGFWVGALRFNRNWSGNFICPQKYTTFKFWIYGRGTLSVVFLPITYILI